MEFLCKFQHESQYFNHPVFEDNTAIDSEVSSVIYKHEECPLDLLLPEETFIAFSSAFGLQKISSAFGNYLTFSFKKNHKTDVNWEDSEDSMFLISPKPVNREKTLPLDHINNKIK